MSWCKSLLCCDDTAPLSVPNAVSSPVPTDPILASRIKGWNVTTLNVEKNPETQRQDTTRGSDATVQELQQANAEAEITTEEAESNEVQIKNEGEEVARQKTEEAQKEVKARFTSIYQIAIF